MPDSTSRAIARKPRPDFPLYVHKTDRWAKKVRGKTLFFGKASIDPSGEAAEALWNKQKDDLYAGRKPRATDADGVTLREVCNKFLAGKRVDLDSGKLSPRTFVEYSRTTDLLIDTFGRDRVAIDLRPDDFEKLYTALAKKHGQTTLGREVTMVRSVFKYAVESDLIDRAVKFGPRFKAPSKADKRKQKAKRKHTDGKRMFEADEIRRMIDAAGPQLKAMIYLGINGGLGNTDCATLPLMALDLDGGWLDFPRPKTGIERRIPLWPETIAALRTVIAKRKASTQPAHSHLVFLTRLGQPWVRYEVAENPNEDGTIDVKGKADDAIAKATGKLLRDLGIYRKGLSFYALRHGFETIGGGCRDQVAVDAIMGHVDPTMAAEYREHVEDARLQAAVNKVPSWLLGQKLTAQQAGLLTVTRRADGPLTPARKAGKLQVAHKTAKKNLRLSSCRGLTSER